MFALDVTLVPYRVSLWFGLQIKVHPYFVSTGFQFYYLPFLVVSQHNCHSVGCLWHSHGKNPVRSYPKLQSQPIGLPKTCIDYLFFQADQSDCTKFVSIFNRFASSEERWNQNDPCQICRPWVFPLVGLGWLVNLRDTGKSRKAT